MRSRFGRETGLDNDGLAHLGRASEVNWRLVSARHAQAFGGLARAGLAQRLSLRLAAGLTPRALVHLDVDNRRHLTVIRAGSRLARGRLVAVVLGLHNLVLIRGRKRRDGVKSGHRVRAANAVAVQLSKVRRCRRRRVELVPVVPFEKVIVGYCDRRYRLHVAEVVDCLLRARSSQTIVYRQVRVEALVGDQTALDPVRILA